MITMSKTIFRITKVAANQPELDEYMDVKDLDVLYEALDEFMLMINDSDVRDRVANLQHLLFRLGE